MFIAANFSARTGQNIVPITLSAQIYFWGELDGSAVAFSIRQVEFI
jgi:hypothetical protein